MISFVSKTISLGCKTEDIENFSVGYMTICGLALTLEEAIAVCESKGIDPETSIKAVAIAQGNTLTEVL